jgi:Calcineurin-like phosphoesterase
MKERRRARFPYRGQAYTLAMPDNHSRDCPHPTSESLANVEFDRKPMVDWLAPGQLARTGLKAAVAATFGSYADKRELQAAMSDVHGVDDEFDFRDGQPLWFDYTADLGDGFNPTYSIARLLADDLTLKFNDETHETRRGDFVLLGGDQVYPTAARDEYQHRFIGPYRAALPYVEHRESEGKYAPAMYALPGNHDWYDGLTSFLRIFCQRKPNPAGGPDLTGRWIGGWRTRQRRSYFAIQLPQDWWIWAIDSQLESDMDHPQLLYFQTLADQLAPKGGDPAEAAKHKIILISAEPSWAHCPGMEAGTACRNTPEAFNTLAHFEKTFIRANGLQLKLVLSGDLHHYVRYESHERKLEHTVRITAGGGGAFLLGTEQMPKVVAVREGTSEAVSAQEPQHVYRKAKAFPDDAESRELADDVWWMPFRNVSFSILIGVVYALFAWLLQTGSRGVGVFEAGSLLDFIQDAPISRHLLGGYLRAFLFSPLSAALGLLIVLGMYGLTAGVAGGYPRKVKALGALHGLAHIILCCAFMSWITMGLELVGLDPGEGWFNFILIAALLLAGWFFGAWLFATYLFFVTKFTGVHAGELYSSMNIEGYKNLLRMRLSPDGTLRVYAIGLRSVPDDWQFVPPGPDGHGVPWYQSRKGLKPHIIEWFDLK